MVQWLGLRAFTAEATSSTPGHRTKILHASTTQQKKKKKLGWERESPVPLFEAQTRHRQGTGTGLGGGIQI